MFKLVALPVEMILEVAEHLPANDLVHLARSNRWLFRVLSPRIDTVALKHRVPGPSHRPSVLHWAVANNHPGLVKRLLALGATIHGFRDMKDPHGPEAEAEAVQSALDPAVENGHYQIAEQLLTHGAQVNKEDPYSFRTPLCTAAIHDKIELAELLLTYGANPYQCDVDGKTPLHFAVQFRSCAMVEKLISLGVYVDAMSESGTTPLHMVALEEQQPHVEADAVAAIVKMFLDAGANIDCRTENDDVEQTVLHCAAYLGNPTVARVLLENGADVAATDAYGCTPLHLAVVGQNCDTALLRLQVVQLLLQYGADINARDAYGDTPLDQTIDIEQFRAQPCPALCREAQHAGFIESLKGTCISWEWFIDAKTDPQYPQSVSVPRATSFGGDWEFILWSMLGACPRSWFW
jgi:ankyrin repeat protein